MFAYDTWNGKQKNKQQKFVETEKANRICINMYIKAKYENCAPWMLNVGNWKLEDVDIHTLVHM